MAIGKFWNSYRNGEPEPIRGIRRINDDQFRTFKIKDDSVEVFDCGEDGTINLRLYTGKLTKVTVFAWVRYLHVSGEYRTFIYEIISDAPPPPAPPVEEDIWL